MMEKASDYFMRTERAVRMLLQEAASYKDRVKLIQEAVSISDATPETAAPQGAFGEWWMKNRNDQNAVFKAYCKYSADAFIGGLLASSVLKIAANAIDNYSKEASIPDEWLKLFRKRILPDRFFVGRSIHTVPMGLIIYCGLNQYANTTSRSIEEINQEVFGRIGSDGAFFEFKAFVDRSCGYRDLHSEYLAANVLEVLGWTEYDQYIKDMKHALL